MLELTYRLHGRDTGKIHLQPFSGKKKNAVLIPQFDWSNIQNQISLQVSSCRIQDRESYHWSTEAHGPPKYICKCGGGNISKCDG